MTYRPVDAEDWIARQPKPAQEAGEAHGDALIRTQVEVAMGTAQDRASKLEHGDKPVAKGVRAIEPV